MTEHNAETTTDATPDEDNDMHEWEQPTKERAHDVDAHLAAGYDELRGGVDRIVVTFEDDNGTHEVEGDVVSFNTHSNFTGAYDGHNIIVETDDEYVQTFDPVDDLMLVRTRAGDAETVVQANRKGCGYNRTIVSDRTPGENVTVDLPDDDAEDDEDDEPEPMTDGGNDVVRDDERDKVDDDLTTVKEGDGKACVEVNVAEVDEDEDRVVYEVISTDPHGTKHRQEVDAVLIGCDTCGNVNARLRTDGTYECPSCGYKNKPTVEKLLRRGRSVDV